MAGSHDVAELEQVSLELVQCTHQPGRLRISRHACALRYLMAQRGKPSLPDDEFGMARKAGLAICKDCDEGRIRAEGLKKR
jgi:hypothetical protein